MNQPYWIWSRNGRPAGKEVCFFRKTFQLDQIPQSCEIKVSADSKYQLYVNGTSIARGPVKSDRYRRYYDTVEIAPYLMAGNNIVAAIVLYFPDDEVDSRIFETGPISIMSTSRAGFLFICESLDISTDYTWLVHQSDSIVFKSPYLSRYATDMIQVSLGKFPQGFEQQEYDDKDFNRAVQIINTDLEKWSSITNWPLTKAPIGAQIEKKVHASRIMRSNVETASVLIEQNRLELPAGGPYYIEIDMGTLTTAYFGIGLEYFSDKDSPVNFTYAESYFKVDAEGNLYKKIRDDAQNSVFDGETDCAILNWGKHRFETLFFRTFRFLRIDVPYLRAPLILHGMEFVETTYPMDVKSVCVHPPLVKKMWDVSVNTLRLCMHDTYEDCPYYEQMQYTMDTSLQMMYTYQLTDDDSLARIAIDSFSASRIPDGLVASNYPCKFLQVIPGFAMYYIEMLFNHYMYFKNEKLIKKYICIAESVLSYFWNKLDEQTGLFERSEYWEFVDWVPEWHHHFGDPLGKDEKINTIYHEMFVYFLKKAADLNEMIGRSDTATEYRNMAQLVSNGIRKYCFDETTGLFTDTVGRSDSSTHAQFWAVLSGVVEGEEAIHLMERVLNDPSLYQCSYSMTFYLFRALEMTGLYSNAARYLKSWESMLELHMSTWSEDPVTQRSDCHGWSSLPIYEFSAMTLGVRPLDAGYEKILIKPYTDNLPGAKGTVWTVKGGVSVEWKKEAEGRISLRTVIPEGIAARIILEGRIHEVPRGGTFEI